MDCRPDQITVWMDDFLTVREISPINELVIKGLMHNLKEFLEVLFNNSNFKVYFNRISTFFIESCKE